MKMDDCSFSPAYYHSLLIKGLDTSTGDTYMDYIIFVQNTDGSGKLICSNDNMKNTLNIEAFTAKPSMLTSTAADEHDEMDPTGTFKIPKIPPHKLNIQQKSKQWTVHSKNIQTQLVKTNDTETHNNANGGGRRKATVPKKLFAAEHSKKLKMDEDIYLTNDSKMSPTLVEGKDVKLHVPVPYKHRRKTSLPTKLCTMDREIEANKEPAPTSMIQINRKAQLDWRQSKNKKKSSRPNVLNLHDAKRFRSKKANYAIGYRGPFRKSKLTGQVKSPKKLPYVVKLRSSTLRKMGKSTRIHRRLTARRSLAVRFRKEADAPKVAEEIVGNADETTAMIGPEKLIIPYDCGLEVNDQDDTTEYQHHEIHDSQYDKNSQGKEVTTDGCSQGQTNNSFSPPQDNDNGASSTNQNETIGVIIIQHFNFLKLISNNIFIVSILSTFDLFKIMSL